MKNELDLRPPFLAQVGKNCIFIRDEKGKPIGHLLLSNRWAGYEINSFVIDEEHRGKGLSHELLKRIEHYPVFCYTRDLRLQSALKKAGYIEAKFHKVNRYSKSNPDTPWNHTLDDFIFDFKRLFHQIKNVTNYKLYKN